MDKMDYLRAHLGNYPDSPELCCKCWSDWDGSPASSSDKSAMVPGAHQDQPAHGLAPSLQISKVNYNLCQD